MSDKKFVHPYIPNSVENVQKEMLKAIGADCMDDMFIAIPEVLRLTEELKIPKGLKSEYKLKKHMDGILNKNISCEEYTSFLGSGCYQHYIPAICDEIGRRSEFLTAYAGEPYEDHGRFMSLFEYCSLMAELLDFDVVNVPTYSWGQAAATSLRMAGRITGRNKILIAGNISPERFQVIKNYCESDMDIVILKNSEEGTVDMEDFIGNLDIHTAGLYFENPSYFGSLEIKAEEISKLLHEKGALSLVGVDPISLGVITPPSRYGADIVTGDVQSLGNHMNFGGGMGGFIASDDKEEIVKEYPSRLFGVAPTSVKGELGFGDVAYDRTSFGVREKGKEFVGTHAALHGIIAGVYLALMGPKGMQEVGETIMANSRYAANEISKIEGVELLYPNTPFFKEFAVNFSKTGIDLDLLNKKLLDFEIFGGKNISKEFLGLEQTSVFCVTEVHTKENIDKLVDALKEILKGSEK